MANSADPDQLASSYCKGRTYLGSAGQGLTEFLYRHSGSVVERPLCDREVAGSIPGRVIPKTLKLVLAALSLGAQH